MADDLRGSMGVVLGLIFLKYLSPTPSRHAEPRVLAEWGEDAPEDLDEYTAENIFLGGARGPVDASEGPSQAVTVGLTVDAAMAAIERHNRGLSDVLPPGYARPALDSSPGSSPSWALSEHNARLANVGSAMTNMAEGLARVEGSIKTINQRLNGVDDRLDRIETKLDRLIQAWPDQRSPSSTTGWRALAPTSAPAAPSARRPGRAWYRGHGRPRPSRPAR